MPFPSLFLPSILASLLLAPSVILRHRWQQLIPLALNVFGKCHPGNCLGAEADETKATLEQILQEATSGQNAGPQVFETR